jgi:hypothetical protein
MGAVAAGDMRWLDNTSASLLFPRNTIGNDRTHRDIAAARHSAGGAEASPGKVIAELMFGFWLFLTARRLEPLIWLPHLVHAFPRNTAWAAAQRLNRSVASTQSGGAPRAGDRGLWTGLRSPNPPLRQVRIARTCPVHRPNEHSRGDHSEAAIVARIYVGSRIIVE